MGSCPLSIYLARLGVGNIGFVDHDKVELSNLNRQIIFDTKDIGKNKVHWLETSSINNWFPTAAELEVKLKKIGKRKNLILILNSPNNPSGAICNNLEEIARVAKKYKLIVLSDEIYTDLYRIGEAQRRMIKADKMVFMGTSFSVNITAIALRIAASNSIDIEIIDPNPIDIGYKHAAYFEMSALEYVESFL